MIKRLFLWLIVVLFYFTGFEACGEDDMNMSAFRRAMCLLRHFPKATQRSTLLQNFGTRSLSSDSPFDSRPGPSLHISPKSGLADDLLDVRVSGLRPGQRVALQAEVETECRRFKLRSEAMFQADMSGQVIGNQIKPNKIIWVLIQTYFLPYTSRRISLIF